MSSSSSILPTLINTLIVLSILFVLLLTTAIRIVPEYKRLSIFRLGRYIGDKGPGVIFLLPFIDRAISIDTRDQFTKVQQQQNLWGAIGETETLVYTEGKVAISGGMWDAVSTTPIPCGMKVRVVRVMLEVERV